MVKCKQFNFQKSIMNRCLNENEQPWLLWQTNLLAIDFGSKIIQNVLH